jgi:hypothetical protein
MEEHSKGTAQIAVKICFKTGSGQVDEPRRKGLTFFVRMHTKKVSRSREEQDIARLTVRISEKIGKK